MQLAIVDEGGPRAVEGVPDQSSSGEAGAVLQKLRAYGVRLAVVCPAGSVQFSSRFGEMVAEERLRRHFGVFETRHDAREWLARPEAS